MKQDKIIKLNKAIQSNVFSGVVLITEEKKLIYEGCNGFRDRANQLPINMDTKFGIASGTKLFTAVGIIRLIEDGKLKLEDPAFNYIDYDFPKYDKNVTIKQLLNHTSGVPDYLDEDELADGETVKLSVPNYDLLKPTDYLPVMPNEEMKSEPGTVFKYNNSAFVFLAMIIEKVAGDYHKWVTEEVLVKANMTSSGFFLMNELPNNTAIGYASDDVNVLKSNIFELPIIGGGDGGMFTTVKDMDTFWNALINGKIISKEWVRKVITKHSKAKNLSYGLGVWLEEKDNEYIPLLFGQDMGVSFESGYNPITKRIHTIISNTEKGAWGISGVLLEE